MGLFRKTKVEPKADITVLRPGDIVLINGAVFKVDPEQLVQLRVIALSNPEAPTTEETA